MTAITNVIYRTTDTEVNLEAFEPYWLFCRADLFLPTSPQLWRGFKSRLPLTPSALLAWMHPLYGVISHRAVRLTMARRPLALPSTLRKFIPFNISIAFKGYLLEC